MAKILKTLKKLTARYVIVCDDMGIVGTHYTYTWKESLAWAACYGRQFALVLITDRISGSKAMRY